LIVAQEKYKHFIDDQQKNAVEIKRSKTKHHSPKRKIRPPEKMQIILSVVAIGALCIGILSGYVKLTESKYEINALNKEIEELQAQVENLTVEVESFKKSGWIEQKAKEELGMQYPLKEQMVFLSIEGYDEKTGSTSPSDKVAVEEEDANYISKVKDFFKKVYAFAH